LVFNLVFLIVKLFCQKKNRHTEKWVYKMFFTQTLLVKFPNKYKEAMASKN